MFFIVVENVAQTIASIKCPDIKIMKIYSSSFFIRIKIIDFNFFFRLMFFLYKLLRFFTGFIIDNVPKSFILLQAWWKISECILFFGLSFLLFLELERRRCGFICKKSENLSAVLVDCCSPHAVDFEFFLFLKFVSFRLIHCFVFLLDSLLLLYFLDFESFLFVFEKSGTKQFFENIVADLSFILIGKKIPMIESYVILVEERKIFVE